MAHCTHRKQTKDSLLFGGNKRMFVCVCVSPSGFRIEHCVHVIALFVWERSVFIFRAAE